MSSVKPDRHIEEGPKAEEPNVDDGDELEEKETMPPPLTTVDVKERILRQHDALRQRMEELLDLTAGLWEENFRLKNEVKNERRQTIGLRTKLVTLKNEVEKLKIEWRRTLSLQENNFSSKKPRKNESRMAEKARKEIDAEGQKKFEPTCRNRLQTINLAPRLAPEVVHQTFTKVKGERIEAVRVTKRKKLRIEEKEHFRKAREVEDQRKALDCLLAKRKDWARKRTRKVEAKTGRKLTRKKWSSNQEDGLGCKGEPHRRSKSPTVVFRSQSIHFDDDRVSSPTPSATGSSEQDTEEENDQILVPDPYFHDFDSLRTEKHILPGQIWAIYDDQDGMPRLYARISRVTTRPFVARINWLDHCPATDEETLLTESTDLLISCGGFKMRRSYRVMHQINPFSHFVMAKVAGGLHKIYPKEGQVWAVYKDPEQEIEPGGGSGKGSKPMYEMVRILSEFCDQQGLRTVKLQKVEGFRTVFRKVDGLEAFRVFKPVELVKFSHNVPSRRIEDSKTDVHGIPRGSLELDTASTPVDLMTSPSDSSR